MKYGMILSLLLLSALLEAGGDAVVRAGLLSPAGSKKILLLGGGGLALFAYGCLVNRAPWEFGRLIGVYVVFVFLVAQAISWLAFGQRPSAEIWLGGALIVLGGLVISARLL